jgi:hypothetical protein
MATKLFNHPETHQRLLSSMAEDVQPDKTADKLAVIRLLKFSVYGFSTHSCNPQRMIFTDSRAALKLNRQIHYRFSLLTSVSLHVSQEKSHFLVEISLRPRRSSVA